MNKKSLLPLFLILLFALLLAGCGESASSDPIDLSTLPRIGTQEGENVYELAVENRSGFAITALSAKCEQTKEFTGNTLSGAEPFEHGTARMLCFAAAKPASDPGDYEMSLVLGKDLFRTLHSVPFSATQICTILSDGDYCYLEYTDASGKKVSTKEQEKAFYQEEKAQSGDDGCIGDDGLVY